MSEIVSTPVFARRRNMRVMIGSPRMSRQTMGSCPSFSGRSPEAVHSVGPTLEKGETPPARIAPTTTPSPLLPFQKLPDSMTAPGPRIRDACLLLRLRARSPRHPDRLDDRDPRLARRFG